MREVYSLWEQGRNIDSGQIVSMVPVSPDSVGEAVAGALPLATGSIALSAIAQFGQYLEQRKANEVRAAEFEERRHDWLNGILDEWVQEHIDSNGIKRDVTEALALECEKLLEKLIETPRMDVPQLLLLRVARVGKFIEENYRLLARAKNRLILASNSVDDWLSREDLDFKTLATETVDDWSRGEKTNAKKRLGGAAFGLPLFFVPIAGPALGGGALGVALSGLRDLVKNPQSEKAREFLPLLQILISVAACEEEAKELHYFLGRQSFAADGRLMIEESSRSTQRLILPTKTIGKWPFKKIQPIELESVPLPSEEQL